MAPRPRPWLLPVVAIVVVMLWVLWLGRDYLLRDDAAVVVAPPSVPTPSPRDAGATRPEHDAAAPVAVNRGSPPSDGRAGGAGTPATQGTEPAAGAAQIAFQVPSHLQIGEAF